MQSTHNVQRLLDLFGTMCRIRAFETAALNAHKEGVVPGPLHVSIGQEGVATGVCMNLVAEDRITSNHRGHGHAIAKGAGVQGMMRELFGRDGGHCRGKGGSMHIADFSVGMLGANGVVSGGIPIAVGAAQGLKMMRSSAIAVCFFGDGAINRGPFLEGLNWAALYQLPVLFICEDNGVSAFTATDTVTAGPGVMARAESLGCRASASTATTSWRWTRRRPGSSPRCAPARGRGSSMPAPSASPATPPRTPPPGATRRASRRRRRATPSTGWRASSPSAASPRQTSMR